jgi:hypothetical protein
MGKELKPHTKKKFAKKTPSLAELKFIRAYAQLGSYTKASREAYPNANTPHVYGYVVANRPHVKPYIDKIKQSVIDQIDEAMIYTRFEEIYNNTLFKKVIVKKTRQTETGTYEEQQEVDQTPLALQALKGIAQFKRAADVENSQAGPMNVTITMDNRILNTAEQSAINQPKKDDKPDVVIDI